MKLGASPSALEMKRIDPLSRFWQAVATDAPTVESGRLIIEAHERKTKVGGFESRIG